MLNNERERPNNDIIVFQRITGTVGFEVREDVLSGDYYYIVRHLTKLYKISSIHYYNMEDAIVDCIFHCHKLKEEWR